MTDTSTARSSAWTLAQDAFEIAGLVIASVIFFVAVLALIPFKLWGEFRMRTHLRIAPEFRTVSRLIHHHHASK